MCSKEEALAAVIAAVEGPAAGTARLLGPKGRELQADSAEAIRAEGDVPLCVVLISAGVSVTTTVALPGLTRAPGAVVRYRPSACSPAKPAPASRASRLRPDLYAGVRPAKKGGEGR